MTELKIKPGAPLCDPEQAEKLAAKRRQLFDSQYRPNHPLVEHWPKPPKEHFFGMPLLKLVTGPAHSRSRAVG